MSTSKQRLDRRPGYRLVYSRRIRLRSGRILYAPTYGLRAFRFWVRNDRRSR